MIKYTFLGDGTSDKTLMKIIDWTFSEKYPDIVISPQFADFRYLREKISSLQEKISKALELYPCHILFVHRDAEEVKKVEQILSKRESEIQAAIKDLNCNYVSLVPIKMMETWLLTDIDAIRKAAGNRNSTVPIILPPIPKLESENSPKEKLYDTLRIASGLKGRQLDSFNVRQAVHRVAEYTTDFSQLRALYSFRKFEEQLEKAVARLGDK